MSANDGVRFHEEERVLSLLSETAPQNPEHAEVLERDPMLLRDQGAQEHEQAHEFSGGAHDPGGCGTAARYRRCEMS